MNGCADSIESTRLVVKESVVSNSPAPDYVIAEQLRSPWTIGLLIVLVVVSFLFAGPLVIFPLAALGILIGGAYWLDARRDRKAAEREAEKR